MKTIIFLACVLSALCGSSSAQTEPILWGDKRLKAIFNFLDTQCSEMHCVFSESPVVSIFSDPETKLGYVRVSLGLLAPNFEIRKNHEGEFWFLARNVSDLADDEARFDLFFNLLSRGLGKDPENLKKIMAIK